MSWCTTQMTQVGAAAGLRHNFVKNEPFHNLRAHQLCDKLRAHQSLSVTTSMSHNVWFESQNQVEEKCSHPSVIHISQLVFRKSNS